MAKLIKLHSTFIDCSWQSSLCSAALPHEPALHPLQVLVRMTFTAKQELLLQSDHSSTAATWQQVNLTQQERGTLSMYLLVAELILLYY